MVMSPGAALELMRDQLIPSWRQEAARLEVIDRWYRWHPEPVEVPNGSTREHKRLAQLARTPWMRLIVNTVAQALRVDGYRSPDNPDTAPGWQRWVANGLDGRQAAIYREAIAYGYAFGTALPGTNDLTGEPQAVLRGVSPRKMLAFYQDPAEDEWPMYAVRWMGQGMWRLYDDTANYYFGVEGLPGNETLTYISYDVHDTGVTPVVRFCRELDLSGRTPGEVEPFIPLAKRINKTTYDRLLIQHFNSWKTRTIAGMSPAEGANEAAEKLRLRQEDILVAEDPDTKFGTLPETALDGILKAYETDVRTFAAASQTPVHTLTGDLINLSAEALAAARADLTAKAEDCQQSFGTSIAQWLRLGAHIDGDQVAASDMLAKVTWQDTSVRSMAQAADALGKLATMLQVPVEALWSKIPGVTRTDVEEWQTMKAADPFAQLASVLDAQATPPTPPAGA